MIREQFSDYLHGIGEEDMLFMDGFDGALIGIGRRFNEFFAIYDYNLVIDILIDMGMTVEEAIEYHEFNQAGAWIGKHTPVFIMREVES